MGPEVADSVKATDSRLQGFLPAGATVPGVGARRYDRGHTREPAPWKSWEPLPATPDAAASRARPDRKPRGPGRRARARAWSRARRPGRTDRAGAGWAPASVGPVGRSGRHAERAHGRRVVERVGARVPAPEVRRQHRVVVRKELPARRVEGVAVLRRDREPVDHARLLAERDRVRQTRGQVLRVSILQVDLVLGDPVAVPSESQRFESASRLEYFRRLFRRLLWFHASPSLRFAPLVRSGSVAASMARRGNAV